MHNFEKRLIAQDDDRAFCDVLTSCLNKLEDHQKQSFSYIEERVGAIMALRELCSKFGDNDWTDDMPLADVISDHLGKYLLGP